VRPRPAKPGAHHRPRRPAPCRETRTSAPAAGAARHPGIRQAHKAPETGWLEALDVHIRRNASHEPEVQGVGGGEERQADPPALEQLSEFCTGVARQQESHLRFTTGAVVRGLPAFEQVFASHECQRRRPDGVPNLGPFWRRRGTNLGTLSRLVSLPSALLRPARPPVHLFVRARKKLPGGGCRRRCRSGCAER
jgi:hypothetical protein